jgi:hypothetical protein
MNAILLDSKGHAERARPLSAKGLAAAAIVAASLGLSGLGAYWLMQPDAAAPPPAAPALPVAAPAEPLISAPPASCVDGRPARADVSPESCV